MRAAGLPGGLCRGNNLARQTGEPAAQLFEAAEAGDAEALVIVRRATSYMGVGLINVTNLFDASYIGPMGTGGYSLNSDLQTLQAGARRLMFLTVGTTF